MDKIKEGLPLLAPEGALVKSIFGSPRFGGRGIPGLGRKAVRRRKWWNAGLAYTAIRKPFGRYTPYVYTIFHNTPESISSRERKEIKTARYVHTVNIHRCTVVHSAQCTCTSSGVKAQNVTARYLVYHGWERFLMNYQR